MSAAGSSAYESSYVRHCSIGSCSAAVLVGMLHWLKKNLFTPLACPSPRGTGADEARSSDPSSLSKWSLQSRISPTPQSSRVRRAIRATEEDLAPIVVDDSAKGNGQQ
ncbi:hypothetical protein CH63R_13118 [Colletotrichum higginsianum IMI 349063]|uniref:Uncharacterized protein n=1 Tax=Colletotrichum higginsianum (strain IMI 349063) TaxID=759273 RepID=A0A1B7XW65_COLHI|nr:hypothetical protein CH63R_13118 [Colletotrichum higginsianum IMI 349063]OBR03991.1 hypothetical protein CH63R_13118 [Colletotrichum higginsianum IMI 349063]